MSNCNCGNTSVIATLAAGATAPYYVLVNLTKRLCRATCVASTPVFSPSFSVVGFSAVGTGQYVASVQVQGVVTYNPCGSSCCAVSEPVSKVFTIPFASATAPESVSVQAGATVNAISANPCQSCSRTFVSETPLTLTVTA